MDKNNDINRMDRIERLERAYPHIEERIDIIKRTLGSKTVHKTIQENYLYDEDTLSITLPSTIVEGSTEVDIKYVPLSSSNYEKDTIGIEFSSIEERRTVESFIFNFFKDVNKIKLRWEPDTYDMRFISLEMNTVYASVA